MTGDAAGLVRVTIELDPASRPIVGWFEQQHRPPQEFRGILELISLLEAAREPSLEEPMKRESP